MTQPVPAITCPHLGLSGDRTVSRTQPDAAHRCFAQTPPAAPDGAHQAGFCLAATHPSCLIYRAAEGKVVVKTSAPGPWPAWLRFVPWIALALLVIAVGVVYGRDLLAPPVAPFPDDRRPPTADRQLTTDDRRPTTENRQLTTDNLPSTPARPARSLATSTPEPGGQALGVAPKAGDAGWWRSGEARGNRLGDSYLYAGYFDGQAFISAARFDVSRVPRGAPIRQAVMARIPLPHPTSRTSTFPMS